VQNTKLFKAITALSIFGIVLATYLFYSYLTKPAFRPCSISANINCDAVIEGPVSTTLGIPTALYGLIGYFVILIGALYKKAKLVFSMALFGLLFCLRITYIELFIIKVICPVCLLCQLTMLSIFGLSIPVLKKDNTPTIASTE
jgi:uncharacterized membrane protein